MSTYLTAFCNTTTDLQMVLPELEKYDNKRTLGAKYIGIVAAGMNIWTSVGYCESVYRDGVDLGAPESALIDVDAANEWFYDSGSDRLYIFDDTNDPDEDLIEVGRDWNDAKTEAVGRASEMVRSLAGKPIMPRKGTGVQSETLRDYEDIIVRSTAHLAVAQLVRPYDFDKAAQIEGLAHNPEGTGWLDMIRRGEIALWNEVTQAHQHGLVREVATDSSTTGGIVDVKGEATVDWDAIKVIIVTGGTFAQGSASSVTYSVYVSDSTGLKNSQVVDAKTIDGGYQTCAHGLSIRFSPGVYVADDEWEIEASGRKVEAGTRVRSITLARLG